MSLSLSIGEAAAQSGVSPKTIRYYESIGLIRPAARAANGYRHYAAPDVQNLRFIQRARGLGFSVKECGALLALYEDKARSSADVKAMALGQVEEIDRKISELRSMRATLSDLAEKCHGDQRPDCPILDDLAGNVGKGPRSR